MGDIFNQLYPDATPEELEQYRQKAAEVAAHEKERPCPRGCGCVEYFDDREPERIIGGHVLPGCKCRRCLGKEG